MKKTILSLFILYHTFAFAQQTIKMSLEQVLELAEKQSLDAFKAKNMYLASYWNYRSYQAKQLPFVDLNLRPMDFRRSMTKRYDFDQNIDVYREQRTMDSYANLSLNQNIPLTGGKIYVDTDLSRLVSFGETEITTFSATLIRFGLVQPILGYNDLKWEKKLSPLKFEKAKQEYIRKLQETKLKAVNLYFNLLLAKTRKQIAENNVHTADTLYKVGKQKFAILSVQQEELLDLELSKFNSEIDLVKANQELEKARFSLNSFLGMDNSIIIEPLLPPTLNLQIPLNDAVDIAFKNNPEILNIKQIQIEADRDLDKAKKENRFNANLTASFGLNQNAYELPDAYKNPLNQQVFIFGINIPLLDWGNAKGKKQMAAKDREVAYIETQQKLNDFKQDLLLKVMDFNLQAMLVKSARKADDIAKKSYSLTKKRFLLGNADVLKITTIMKTQQNAEEKYINSIYNYWKKYYEIQQITLHNFMDNTDINVAFDELIDN